MPKKPGDIKISREQQNAVQEMQTAVMNKLTLGFNNYPETQKLFNRLGYASNFANAISADDAYDIEDNMDKLQQDGGLIAALTQPVPWGDGSTSFYQYLTQNDLELKAKIDNGLKALNDIADFKWNLDFKPIQVNQDISELSGGRTAPGYNAPQKDAGEIINDLRDSLNIPRTQERQQGAMERQDGSRQMNFSSLQEKLGQTNTNLAKHTASKVGSLGNINDREIKKALDKFDTKRLFGQRASRSHQRVTDAVNSMVTLKNSGEGSLSASLGQVENRQEKMQRAVQWMSAAQEMFYQADIYVNQKDPLTFAGRDRKNGAKDLRNIAAREIKAAEDAIRAAGGEEMLQEVYRGVAQQKAMAAENLMSRMDISKPTQERNGRSIDKQVEDQKHEVRRLMLDSLAAHVSEMALHDSPQNTAGANFHNIRTHLEWNVKLAMAVYDHIEGNWNNKAELDKWVKDPGKMIQDIRTNGDYKDLGDRLMDYTKPLEHRGKVMEDANKAVKKEQGGRIMG